MRSVCRGCFLLLVPVLLLGASGCAMFDFMKPSNTWRLNRGPALDEGDAYFSVSDPAATITQAE